MKYLAACCVFKDEAPNLPEWLAFHYVQGVSHFYLYNNDSTDAWEEVLKPWADTITLHPWPGACQQLSAYNHCLQTHGKEAKWMAFTDLDEYLFSPVSNELCPVLELFYGYSAVGAHWMCYGPCNHKTRPAGLTIESYLERPRNTFATNRHFKMIVQPACTRDFYNPHHCRFLHGGYAVDEATNRISGPISEDVRHNLLRINHYTTRSWEEWDAKVAKGRPDVLARRNHFEAVGYDKMDVHDTAILRLLDRTKAELRRRGQCH